MSQPHDAIPTLPADIRIDDEGGHLLLTPVTEAGRAWLAAHLPADAVWRGGSAEVEARGLDALVNRMTDAGLAVLGPM
jgi:hypothetical protein